MTTGAAKSTASTSPSPSSTALAHTPRQQQQKPTSANQQRVTATSQHASSRSSEGGRATGLAVPIRGRSPGAAGSHTVAGRRRQQGGAAASKCPVRTGGYTTSALSFPRRAKSAGSHPSLASIISTAGAGVPPMQRNVEGISGTTSPVRTDQSNVQVHYTAKSSTKSGENLTASKSVQDTIHSLSQNSGMRSSGVHPKSSSLDNSKAKGKSRPVQVVRPLQRVQTSEGASGISAPQSRLSNVDSPSGSSGLSQTASVSRNLVYSRDGSGETKRMGNPVSRELLVASGLEDSLQRRSNHGNARMATLPSALSSDQSGSFDGCSARGKTLPSSIRSSLRIDKPNGATNQVDGIGSRDGTHDNSIGLMSRESHSGQQFGAFRNSNNTGANSGVQDGSGSASNVENTERNIQNSREKTSALDGCRSKTLQHSTRSSKNQNATVHISKNNRMENENSPAMSQTAGSSDSEGVKDQVTQRKTDNSVTVAGPHSNNLEIQAQSNAQSQDNASSQPPPTAMTGQARNTLQVHSRSAFTSAVTRNEQQSQTPRVQPVSISSHPTSSQSTSGYTKSVSGDKLPTVTCATNHEASTSIRTITSQIPQSSQTTSSRPQTIRASPPSNGAVNRTRPSCNNQPTSNPLSVQPSNTSRNNQPRAADNSSLSVDIIQNSGAQPPHDSADRPSVLQRYDNNQDLPDILNSHLLPPYTAIRPNQHRTPRPNASEGHRDRQGNRSQGNGRSQPRNPSNSPPGMTDLPADIKECCSRDCCVRCITVATTFRWVLVSLALLGVCCVVTGIILGALHMTVGEKFLTLSLMFIGLGVLLVVVVGVGWRCTPAGHEPCHVLFNMGEHRRPSTRTRTTRQPRRDRGGWYGGMLYPEFRNRRPPPSYAASMQDQPVDGGHQSGTQDDTQPNNTDDISSLPSSPPPTYRSQSSTVRPGIHITFPVVQGGAYPSSRPPTYRSSAGDVRPSINMIAGDDVRNARCRSETQTPTNTADSANRNPQIDMGVAEGSGDRLLTTVTIDTACHSTVISVTAEEGTRMTPPDNIDVSESETNTLHREREVVQYLEGVLDDQIRKLSVNNSGAEEEDICSGIVDEVWYENEHIEVTKEDSEQGEDRFIAKCDKKSEHGQDTKHEEEFKALSENSDGSIANCASRYMDSCNNGFTGGSVATTDENKTSDSTEVTVVNSYVSSVHVNNYVPSHLSERAAKSTELTDANRVDSGTSSQSQLLENDETVCSDDVRKGGFTLTEEEKERGVSMKDEVTQSLAVVTRTTETQTSDSSGDEMEGQFSDTPL